MKSSAYPHRTVMDVMMNHRSVRSFTAQPLEPGTLERLVTAGAQASTSSNMQAYTVISIEEPSRKRAVAELCANQSQIHQSAAFLVFCADLHKLSLVCRMHDADDSAAGVAEAFLVAVIDTALVLQNVAIAAESMGLGICMIGAVRNHPREIGKLLELPRYVIALAGFCVGYPAEVGEVKPRLPLDATLHREKYRPDAQLERLIGEYDKTQVAWYAEQDMHPHDPRWSTVMARRLSKLARRVELGEFIKEQGFLSR